MLDTELAPSPVAVRPPLPGMRAMSAARAALHARLGASCTLDLWPQRAPHERIRMTLYADDSHTPQVADWTDSMQLLGPCGALQLSDGARWLRALSGIDLADGPDDDWLCGALLGALDGTPLEASALLRRGGVGPLGDEVVLRWVLHSSHHSVACHARADAATWCALLARADWRTQAAPLAHFPALPVSTRVVLARHTLPQSALAALFPGDIILPDRPAFDCAGRGRLTLAGRVLDLAWRAPHHFAIVHLEPCMEPYDLEGGAAALPLSDFDAQSGEPAAHAGMDPDALAALPVSLDFVLGRIQLPLGRLQQLAVGGVLELSHGSPLDVAIDCGGRVLGRAEVLDVEGRLALRVTRWGGAS